MYIYFYFFKFTNKNKTGSWKLKNFVECFYLHSTFNTVYREMFAPSFILALFAHVVSGISNWANKNKIKLLC